MPELAELRTLYQLIAQQLHRNEATRLKDKPSPGPGLPSVPSGASWTNWSWQSTFLRGAAAGPESQNQGMEASEPPAVSLAHGPELGTMSTFVDDDVGVCGDPGTDSQGSRAHSGRQRPCGVCPVCHSTAHLSVCLEECSGGTQHVCTLLERTQAPGGF